MIKQFTRTFLFLVFCLSFFRVSAQYNVSGTVTDKNSDNPLIGAVIMIQGTDIGAYSDENGKFSIESPKLPPFTLVATYLGYDDITLEVKELKNNLVLSLLPSKDN